MSDQQTINLAPTSNGSTVPLAPVSQPTRTKAEQINIVQTPATTGSSDSNWTGRSLGEYEIGPLLGAGGNGQVYSAIHKWLEMPVAIKFLMGVHPDDEVTAQRFRREATTNAKLIHPNLVRATDGGRVGSQLFLVTERVDGSDLSDLTRQHGRLSVPDACKVILEASKALQFVASNDAIHRDIKPSNIMVDRNGNVKVLDMGLARINNHSETMTETGQVMGTIDFMAPEQALDPRGVSFQADMYSLGCTFYFLLTGQVPYSSDEHDTLAAKLMAHMEATCKSIASFRSDVPRAIDDLIQRMIEKDPKRRPRSFAAVEEAVAEFAVNADLKAMVAGEHSTTSQTVNYSWSDKLADDIVHFAKVMGQYFLFLIGVLEFQPQTRPGQRRAFQLSFRWTKFALGIAFFWFVLWAMGFQFLFLGGTSERNPRAHYEETYW
ncbi:MAG: serine/threonine-protein kinase [Pirellulaceae bacterium]